MSEAAYPSVHASLLSAPAYGPGIPKFGLSDCVCACCDEARNRCLHERSWWTACSCRDYDDGEWCACRFCRDMRRAMT